MEDAGALGRLIRESRLKKGMSLGQLAAAVGRTSSSVRRWERGEVPPAKAIIPDLAVALNLDPEDLDALRPSPSMPESVEPDSALSDGSDERPSTIEQPVITESGPIQAPTQAQPVEPIDSTSQTTTRRGILQDVVESYRSVTDDWSGWIRGALTAAVLLIMLIVLVWALGELWSAMGEIWDSFDAGSTP